MEEITKNETELKEFPAPSSHPEKTTEGESPMGRMLESTISRTVQNWMGKGWLFYIPLCLF